MRLIFVNKPIEVNMISVARSIDPPFQSYFVKTTMAFPQLDHYNGTLVGCLSWEGDIYISPLYMMIAKKLGRCLCPLPLAIFNTVVHELVHKIVQRTSADKLITKIIHNISHRTGGLIL